MPETNSEEQDYGTLIEGHTYDGIEEYDNPMPRWWLYTFYLTIAWGIFYLIGISVGWIDTYEDSLAKENVKIDKLVAAAAEAAPDVTPESLQEAVASGEYLESGKAAFVAYCAACHGQNGEGGVGPNLTDSSWIHGGTLMDIYRVADEGVIEKSMPAWGAVLKHDGLLGVVTYIDSIRDTNVEGGKEAQGTVYKAAGDSNTDGGAQPSGEAENGDGVDGQPTDGAENDSDDSENLDGEDVNKPE